MTHLEEPPQEMVPISVWDNVTKHSGGIPNVHTVLMLKGDPAGVSVEKSIVPRGASAASSCITSLSSSLLCMADSHFARARSSREDHHVCVSIVCLLYASAPCSALHRYLLSRSTSHPHQLIQPLHLAVQTIHLYHVSCSSVEFVVESAEKPDPLLTLVEVKGRRVVFYTLVPLVRPLVACELCCVLFPLCSVYSVDPSSSSTSSSTAAGRSCAQLPLVRRDVSERRRVCDPPRPK
jgi:hypothetical protein